MNWGRTQERCSGCGERQKLHWARGRPGPCRIRPQKFRHSPRRGDGDKEKNTVGKRRDEWDQTAVSDARENKNSRSSKVLTDLCKKVGLHSATL